MKTKPAILLCIALALLSSVTTAAERKSDLETDLSWSESLDHFKCYLTRGEPVGATVLLRDQFETAGARVMDAVRFCNPVGKIDGKGETPIHSPDAHLKFYRISGTARTPTRRVLIANQFGKYQKLEIARPLFLAVPTQKQAPERHRPPKGLDHFKCYQASGNSIDTEVDLKDQFHGERHVKVHKPFVFCSPVEKRRDNRVTPIRNRDAHLMCYRIEGAPFETKVQARNQFGEESNPVGKADLLCVPSRKLDFAPEPVPGEVRSDIRRSEQRAALATEFQGCVTSTPDFVVTGSETTVSGDEHCFASNGAGVFGPRTDIPGLSRVDGMDVADMDGDGDNDFLVCDGTAGEVYLYTQGPAGLFTPSLVATGVTSGIGGSVYCTYLREGDFNEDGLKDFVVGDNRVTTGLFVYLQGPVGSFTKIGPGLDMNWAAPDGNPCNCLFGLAAGDVDGDAHQDVLVLGYRGAGAAQLHFYQGNGAGGMAAPVMLFDLDADFPIASAPTGLALFDFDGDGDLDIVAGGSADGSHYVYTNSGTGTFTPPAGPVFDLNNYTGIDAYDFDGDSDQDLALVDWTTRRLVYVENLGGSLAAPVGAGVVDGSSIGIGAPQPKAPSPEGLGHFKCYPTEGTGPVDETVSLRDQFGAADARVGEAVRFCNPVRKAHGDDNPTPVGNRDAHLMLYRIETEGSARRRTVRVGNQFGEDQHLEVSEPLFLAVPTQKRYPKDHAPPQGLDHFKCYRAEGEAVDAVVGLDDQFQREPQVKVHAPFALCNPVEKKHRFRKPAEVRNPKDHLMCYRIEGEGFEADVRTRNQFGDEGFRIKRADLLCVPSTKTSPSQEPNITQLCGDNDAVDFDGGMVLPGGPGTGLLRENPSPAWPDGRPRRPCGDFVPIAGFLPDSGVKRFRIAYRPHTQPVPPLGTAPGIHTQWVLRDRSVSPFCKANPANVLETSGPQAWMDADAYLEAKSGGPSTDWCPNDGLRLAVWDSADSLGLGPADPDGHYILWLEWEDNASVLHKEPFEHHLQLDNTLPAINDFRVTLEDGTTPVGACGEAPEGEHIFKVYADFEDDYYWGYKLRVRGGNPPKTISYGWHNYYDGDAPVAHTDKTGTTPVSTTVLLRDIDMEDFGKSFTDCCYLLELFVRDAAIRHSFNHRVADETTSGYWDDVSEFITFSAAPAP